MSSNNLNLTQSELQSLISFNANIIYNLEEEIRDTKYYINYHFKLCNPEDSNTAIDFYRLNLQKDNLRSLRKQKNKLAIIQAKLKRTLAQL